MTDQLSCIAALRGVPQTVPARCRAVLLGSWLTGALLLFLALPALAGISPPLPAIGNPSPFLAPAKAFRFRAKIGTGDTLILQWITAPHYHLYRNRITVQLAPKSVHLTPYTLPPGKLMHIPGVGTLAVYEGDTTTVRVPITFTGTLPTQVQVTSNFQGCANAGVCYPVESRMVALATQAPTVPAAPIPAGAQRSSPANVSNSPASGRYSRFASGLHGSRLPLTLLLYFLAGLGLAFTPCIFPMIPILSSLIVGQGDARFSARQTRHHAFRIALAYVVGMSLTYALAGVAAAITGSYLQAFFQNPWVLGGFSALFAALALSMFGIYELQMPSVIQSRLSRYGKGGHIVGAGVMGALSALIVGPCVAAPLAGALLFIAHTGNLALGGLALFLLGLGMGMPLLLIGTSAGYLLPKAGAWMNTVKGIFGVVLLGVAIWFLSRILPAPATLGLWAALAIVSSVYLGLFTRPLSGGGRFLQGLGLLIFAYGLALGAGALAGGSQVLEPLAPFVAGPSAAVAMPAGTPRFTRVRSLSELQSVLATDRGHPVLVDFWAKWCVECQRMDVETYDNPRVENVLVPFQLIRVDVTANDQASQTLLHYFQLFGPPAVLLVRPDGKTVAQYEGYEGVETLLTHIRQEQSGVLSVD